MQNEFVSAREEMRLTTAEPRGRNRTPSGSAEAIRDGLLYFGVIMG